ncbi:MAG: hypothetical protein R3Y13_02170 [bacterium]
MSSNKKNKKALIISISIYLAFLIYSIIVNQTLITGYKAINILAAIVSPPLIYLTLRIIKIKIIPEITYIIFGFNLLSIILGNTLKLYRLWDPYDKILHFLSGVIIALFIYCIFLLIMQKKNIKKKNEFILSILFVNGLNISVAFLWELFEFSLLVFFGIDAIRHKSTGVYDLMLDILVCMIGGIIISIYLYLFYKIKKNNVVTKMGETFYIENTKEK